ncbi:MAG: 16S rRNA m(4)C1402 methyltransferase [Pelotomaculum sp. PtaU1.Bin035]|nr:MAG: 16S rRNA m(4)C1402 methyltransferase [Pelotomaculum sp. PtaU1.Bin035]
MTKGLGNAVHLAHMFISEVVKRGGTAVDATAGNGNDTLFLARLVEAEGRIYAFDIQKKALIKTRELLERYGAAKQVTLINSGHEEMESLISGNVDAVIFNLGYLPGGDHSLVTKPDTSVVSLESAIRLLRLGGRVALVIYTGHPGGSEERDAVEQFIYGLDRANYNVIKINILNRAKHAPMVIIVEKAGALNESQAAAQNP